MDGSEGMKTGREHWFVFLIALPTAAIFTLKMILFTLGWLKEFLGL